MGSISVDTPHTYRSNTVQAASSAVSRWRYKKKESIGMYLCSGLGFGHHLLPLPGLPPHSCSSLIFDSTLDSFSQVGAADDDAFRGRFKQKTGPGDDGRHI